MEYVEISALRRLTDWITVVDASTSRQNRDSHFLATVAQLAVVGAGPSALTPKGTVYAAGKLRVRAEISSQLSGVEAPS